MKTTVVAYKVPEWKLQAAVIERLHKLEAAGLPIACAGDQNAARRTPSQIMEAKALGMTAGEPDVRVYIPGGRILHIEMKAAKGRLSDEQKERHARLRALGHIVTVISLPTCEQAADDAELFVRQNL